ncbi:MAG: hypothetical protein HMLIMOIP_001693 [Candidatus Nitrosomirales archaeon]|jgi:hypothetical protein
MVQLPYTTVADTQINTAENSYNVVSTMLVTLNVNEQEALFLSKNQDVVLALPEIISTVCKTLGYEIFPKLEIMEDEESLDVRRLAFIFDVKAKSYEEVLEIWDDVSKEVYKSLNNTTAKKISIILEGD